MTVAQAEAERSLLRRRPGRSGQPALPAGQRDVPAHVSAARAVRGAHEQWPIAHQRMQARRMAGGKAQRRLEVRRCFCTICSCLVTQPLRSYHGISGFLVAKCQLLSSDMQWSASRRQVGVQVGAGNGDGATAEGVLAEEPRSGSRSPADMLRHVITRHSVERFSAAQLVSSASISSCPHGRQTAST